MRTTFTLIMYLLFAGFSESSHAQGGYGTPCAGTNCATCCVNPAMPGPSEYLLVQCNTSNCVSECGPCKQIVIKNMYTCKNIVKIEFLGPSIWNKPYSICNTRQHKDGQVGDPCQDIAWETPDIGHPTTYDPSQKWRSPCWFSTDEFENEGEHWWISANQQDNCPDGAGYDWSIYIDFCGQDLQCQKISWLVHFSDGSTCPVNMANIASCCP